MQSDLMQSDKADGVLADEGKVAKDEGNRVSAEEGEVAAWHKRTMRKRKMGRQRGGRGMVTIASGGTKRSQIYREFGEDGSNNEEAGDEDIPACPY